MSAPDLTAQLAAKADRFVQQLCDALLAKLDDSAPVTPVAAIRSHLLSTFRALPTSGGKKSIAFREFLLRDSNLDQYVQIISKQINLRHKSKPTASSSTSSTSASFQPLFHESCYINSLDAIETSLEQHSSSSTEPADAALNAYQPLLLPNSAPAFVSQHLIRSLTRQSEHKKAFHLGGSVLANPVTLPILSFAFSPAHTLPLPSLLGHLESLVLLARQQPLSHSTLVPLSSLIDRVSFRFAPMQLDTTSLRRYQNLTALLLLEEAKRISKDAWSSPNHTAKYAARIRSVLRKVSPNEFTGSLAGELMFLLHAFASLQEHKVLEKVHRAAVVAKASTHGPGNKRARSRSRSPARSPSPSSSPSRSSSNPSSSSSSNEYHDSAFFHALYFLPLFGTIAQEVSAVLETGTRASEGQEGELLRFATLLRTIEQQCSTLSASFAPLRASIAALSHRFPSIPLPLQLKAILRERFPSIQQCHSLWQSNSPLKNQQLDRLLVEIEGEVAFSTLKKIGALEGMKTKSEEENASGSDSDSDQDEDKEANEQPQKKKAKTTAAASSSSSDLFFLDSTGSGGASGESEEATVGRNMTKILATLPKTKAKPKSKAKGKKGVKAEEEEKQEEAEEGIDATAASDAAKELDPTSSASEPAAMEVDGAEETEHVEEEPAAAPKKGGRAAARAKKEAPSPALAPAAEPRSTRTKKK